MSSWPPLGERPPTPSSNGCRASNIGHDADFTVDGNQALMAYGDEGLFTLDLTDPSRPRRLGQFDYPEARSVEGNASYVSAAEVGGAPRCPVPRLHRRSAAELGPLIGMTATASGRDYWMVAADGGIFAFGNATFLGGTGATSLARPITGMAAVPK